MTGLFPSEFREAHASEMEQVLRTAHRARSREIWGSVRFWTAAILDVLQSAPAQHLDALAQDLRYAGRSLRRAPGFAATAFLALALGIGATTAVFTVFSAVLVRPLPYREPSRLALVWATDPSGSRTWLSAPEIEDLSRRLTTIEGIAGMSDLRLAVTGAGEPEELDVVAASASLFPLLGVSAEIGHTFTEAEARETATPVVLLSQSLWRRRFGSRNVVGAIIRLDGRPHAVAGVLPETFGMIPPSSVFPRRVDAFVALPQHLASHARDVRYLHGVARIRDGVPVAAARQEIAAVGDLLSREYASEYGGRHRAFDIVGMQDDLVSGVRPALVVLLAIVAFVLLIACANVGTLLLARAEARRREMAVRCALGASRSRVVRQLLTEGLVIALIGGIGGLLIAAAAPRVTAPAALVSLPRFSDVSLDWRVFLFAAVVSVGSALLFTLAPAAGHVRARSRSDLDVLRTGARTAPAARAGRFLAGAEIALATMVLAVALVLARGFARIVDGDPGFAPAGVISARVSLPSRYQFGQDQTRFFDAVLDGVRAIPGVRSAAAVSQLPLSGAMLGSSFILGASAAAGDAAVADADLRAVTPDYFRTLGIALVAGRGFTERDDADSPAVAVVDETLARRFWRGGSPIGGRLRWSRQPDVSIEIVGVARGVRHRSLVEPPHETVYRPLAQSARRAMFVVARTDGDPAALGRPLAAAVQAVDPDQPVAHVVPMPALMAEALAQPGFGTAMGITLAVLALSLTAVGVSGVVAFAMSQRRREIGVRLALGSTRREILAFVVRDGARLAGAGLAAGLPLAYFAARWVEARLPGMGGADPLVLTSAGAVILGSAVAASWIPAYRASRIDPATVLRADS